MQIQVLTPEKKAYDGEVDSILAPGKDGNFEIYKNHAPILSSLIPGILRIRNGQTDTLFHLSGGFLEFNANKAIVLAEAAETPSEIDLKRAKAAKERALGRIQSHQEVDVARAQRSLSRALSRERVYEKYGA